MNITREELIKAINEYKLYFVWDLKTTDRVSKGKWYIIKDNELIFVNGKLYTSRVIGMSRVFEMFLSLLEDFQIDCKEVPQNYWKLN